MSATPTSIHISRWRNASKGEIWTQKVRNTKDCKFTRLHFCRMTRLWYASSTHLFLERFSQKKCFWKFLCKLPDENNKINYIEIFNYTIDFYAGEFTKRVQEKSSQLFVTLYTISIYPSAQKTAETTSPEPFSWTPLYVALCNILTFCL